VNIFNKSILVLSMLLLTSCVVGPDYKRPAAPLSKTYKEAKGKKMVGSRLSKDWKIAEPRDQIKRGEWWRVFHDAKLNELEIRLNRCNQNIKNAVANYFQALALVDEARASYFPLFGVTASATRQRTVSGSTSFTSASSTGSIASGTATAGISTSKTVRHVSTNHSLLFNSSWDIDIWGAIRRQVEANASGAQASAALIAATKLSAEASLATIYFELRGIDTDQVLLNKTVIDYKKALKLTKNQYASGVASRADVIQARSQLESAQALAINNGIARAQYEHAIAVLIGVPPANFTLPHKRYTSTIVPLIPLSLPSALLERRPDVAEAERLMQQANAEIGVAISAYFPSLTLLATSSVTGTGLSHWFSLPTMAWSYGAQLSQIIYDGGLRNAEVRAAKAGYYATVASYRQIVLTAFQQVEDNLASLRILSNEARVQDAAAASAVEALRLVLNEYKAGTVAYSSVITAQIAAYTAQKTAADIRYQQMTAAVGLIAALGGGWNASCIRCAG